jgi:crotonobetainyl-CoA:carnitine CoA-transferase CaiB-like acyl-CoA transferase
VPYEMFHGGDGRHFVVGVGTEAIWKRFVAVIGVESGIGSDARFQTNALRIQNRTILVPLLQKTFTQCPASEWLEQLRTAEVPAAAINTVAEALHTPQTQARNLIVQLEHPALGIARSIANPIKFSGTPVSYRLPPPLLGEHTKSILQTLGYSNEEANSIANDSAA